MLHWQLAVASEAGIVVAPIYPSASSPFPNGQLVHVKPAHLHQIYSLMVDCCTIALVSLSYTVIGTFWMQCVLILVDLRFIIMET